MRSSSRSRLGPLGPRAWTDTLADAFGLTDYSDRASRTTVARALIYAAVLARSLSAAAKNIVDIGRETLRLALAADLPQSLEVLEDRVIRGLHHALPRQLRRKAVPLAIDVHLRPYYGQHNTPGLCGGPRKNGARWFFGYATAVTLLRGQRHTLALIALRRAESSVSIVNRILAQVGHCGIRIRYVLLDRGFYSSRVINALQRRKLRYIIPMVRRGKKIAPFYRRSTTGWFEHTLRNRKCRADSATTRVASYADGYGRARVYVCSEGFHSLPRIVLNYQRRFGIEASYRQLSEALARTTSRDVRFRLLLVAVSILIRAWWLLGDGQTLGALRDQLLRFLFQNPPQPQPLQTPPENP